MKKTLIAKTLLLSVIATLMIALCSCGLLFGGLFDDSDDNYNDYYNDTTDYGNGYYDDTPNYEDESNVPDPVTVTTTANDTDEYGLAGSYTMLKSKEYNVGDAVDLSATVNEGYNFEGWYIVEKTGYGYYEQTNLVLLSEQTNYTYTMQDKSVTIAAIFSSYTITTASSTNTGGAAGSFTRLNNKKVSNGETVELTATVNDGYNFEGWYIDGVCVSRNLTYNYTMEKENANIEARYSCYQLSTVGYAKNANGDTEAGFHAGTYTQYSNKNLSAGEIVTLTATVNDGYNFEGWYIDGNCVSTDFTYTHTMEKNNVIVEAVYSYYVFKTTAAIRFSYFDVFSEQSLYIYPIYDSKKISIGNTITVTANNVEGYTFYAWMVGDAVLTHENILTYTMPAEDIHVYAAYHRD